MLGLGIRVYSYFKSKFSTNLARIMIEKNTNVLYKCNASQIIYICLGQYGVEVNNCIKCSFVK